MSTSITPPRPPPSAEAQARTRRQQGLFFGGVAFVVFSSLVTRRALARRYRPITQSLQNSTPVIKSPPTSAQGAGYTPASAASQPSAHISSTTLAASEAAPTAQAAADATQAAREELTNSGPMVALEALSLATLNVLSWTMMVAGGALWAFDISSMDDLRRKVRKGMGIEGRTEQDAEEEIEEWLATVLARRDEKALKRGEGGAAGAER